MLAPNNRRVLLEALRPPDGYRFDRAVATTYTLDLMALLVAPISFSMFDDAAVRGSLTGSRSAGVVDPFALLQAARSYAERMSVFCQSTRIAAPMNYQRLFTYLEPSIVEVNARHDAGVFHPKIWAVRMVDDESGAVAYRVLVLSRNLTFDQSWDTALVLDGELAADRTRSISASRPLADLVSALPSLAVRPPSQRILDDVALVADELRRVHFEIPHPFEEMSFHPIGIDGYEGSPLPEAERALIVSPFVTADALNEIADRGLLISRGEELAKLPAARLSGFETYVLADGAEVLEVAGTDDVAQSFEAGGPPPVGLHAKLYAFDAGWNAEVWTGSANASTAAVRHNVEFLVQLVGKKSQVGIDVLVEGRDGVAGLRPLLERWTPPPEPEQTDPVGQLLEDRLRRARTALAKLKWIADVEPTGESFDLKLKSVGMAALLTEVAVDVWPISVAETFSIPLSAASPGGYEAAFGGRSFDAITSFFAVRLRTNEGDHADESVFVINAELRNAPANRAARVLESLLSDPQKVLQFLRMLLATEPLEVLEALRASAGALDSSAQHSNGFTDMPLLEAMLRALDRDPTRLDAIDHVVKDLMSTEKGALLLPPDFLAAWEPVRAARQTLQKGSNS